MFFQKILPLCMVSFQELFLIKSSLYCHAYGIQEIEKQDVNPNVYAEYMLYKRALTNLTFLHLRICISGSSEQERKLPHSPPPDFDKNRRKTFSLKKPWISCFTSRFSDLPTVLRFLYVLDEGYQLYKVKIK